MEPGFLWRSVTRLAYRRRGVAFFSGAQQNMTESMQSAGAPDETKPTVWQKTSKWVYAIVGLIGVGIGGLKIADQFTLPSCAADRTTTTVRDSFKGKGVELVGLNDMKRV